LILHTREWGAGDRIAVLLHGTMADSRAWWRVGPALALRGYRAIGVDLPGHGRSPRDGRATLEDAVDALLRSVPPAPALAIGHSRGGSILAAAVDRLRPTRAVYVDVPFAVADHRDPAELTALHATNQRQRTLEYLRRERSWWSETDREVDADAATLFDVATTVSISLSAAGRDLTPTTHLPSLMVRAEPSACVPPDEVARLRRLGFEIRSVPGAGHSVWYGHFDEFMSTLDGWV
jgi:pimeloyl-ACP methyl ester carboxylesterase